MRELQGAAHGYPAVLDLNGKKLANGEFLQWADGDKLHVHIIYKYQDGRRIEERAVLLQRPELAQKEWSWTERKNEQLLREFKIDFAAKSATARKRENGALQKWSKQIDVDNGRTFAGFGFTIALQNLRARLLRGDQIELRAIGFSPKPQAVTVRLSHKGVDRMEMSGRVLKGDHFVIHPEIPMIAKLFVKVPDTSIWLTNPAPAGFLRWEGPVAEPADPLIRVDLVSGDESGPAAPVRKD